MRNNSYFGSFDDQEENEAEESSMKWVVQEGVWEEFEFMAKCALLEEQSSKQPPQSCSTRISQVGVEIETLLELIWTRG